MPVVSDAISAVFQLGFHCSSLGRARCTCEPTSDFGGVAKTVRRYQEFLLIRPRRKRGRLFEFCGRELLQFFGGQIGGWSSTRCHWSRPAVLADGSPNTLSRQTPAP
jgi:hypothetical protein